ncbi:MAG: PH domain-containing protein [bacterium]|nr:MAG: PH domain-containing protein [bacterium]
METRKIKPSNGYLKKLRLILTIVAFVVIVFGYGFGLLIGIEHGSHVATSVFIGFLIADLVWWIPALILAGLYYKSLSYEIQDDEVIVRVGIVTKSVKHVPYRTVTNVTVNRGILDRYVFKLGSLNIQTAGMSGTTGAEESLVGLANVQEVYDIVVQKLRLFRGGMAPTTTEVDIEPVASSGTILNAILNELKAIRQNTEK